MATHGRNSFLCEVFKYADPLRFIGGASSSVLIEAAHSVSPHTTAHVPLADQSGGQADPDAQQTEVPIFVRGKVWPELPFLPRPEQLTKPPQYVSDLLIRLYFDQLHYTLPVVFKPHFMRSYRQMVRKDTDSMQSSSIDRRFLMIFYAICACASSLLPSTSDTGFPGIEHYEKALLLYYASTGEASLERVQCLALLSMCAAGWNTLTQSWILAGQAVRAAQDIGIHLSRRTVGLNIEKRIQKPCSHLGTDRITSSHKRYPSHGSTRAAHITKDLVECVYSRPVSDSRMLLPEVY